MNHPKFDPHLTDEIGVEEHKYLEYLEQNPVLNFQVIESLETADLLKNNKTGKFCLQSFDANQNGGKFSIDYDTKEQAIIAAQNGTIVWE